ncbi:hypothetical protein DMB44_05480 [Thermoplasma sp. Kam2015]|uniref:hypothetical protein n=1 Tax=Thermoplasma sp. Kam2015 TaxID=2094122 RepID=UPI000D81EB67|nr:hypothetical protein [Thermoplasma sp. Kam2015]PYB68173.1 hypothetical protein DMB44_05480 [Thermoplasma sp. Kam2015]
MNIPERRRPGRPRQAKPAGEQLTQISVYITANQKAKLEALGISPTDLLRNAIDALTSSKIELEERKIQEEIQKHELETAKLRIQLNEIEQKKARQKELEKAMRVQERMPAVALRLLIQDVRRLTPNEKKLSDPDGIARRYGIALDIEKFNSDFLGYAADVLAGNEEAVAKEVGVRIVDSDPVLGDKIRAFAEKEILREIDGERMQRS